ncbi:hypothetical protein BAUCODRAFT_27656 [Baudoinia panamericana UAMH 10762]|uniref:FAD-binding domain-containing protein n=1 Tax=Baudoinia panamericana (strain UAMH 10762) TaxID=717646 RepID=M2MLU1_BAUPA|nr:uncharacterized protein BAUCODRAFT_27656 [Baudoinia panamericana UAMH 10762]EMC92358.1 hypothetical protein BAUCODRAFT_27656 [Baudoinia panamericana UAMH 10762]
MASQSFSVAIIGGGLCGLALAVALRHRGVSSTVYESRGSFTELGAGINIGPNSYRAFQLIDSALAESFLEHAVRNPPGKEQVWFQVRTGAATGPPLELPEAHLISEFLAPPTGNMTIGRNGLLQLLAEKAGLTEGEGTKNAAFNKKLTGLHQTESEVTMSFEDGTKASASAVIACDGIHSNVRKAMVGTGPASIPQFSEVGAYRALLSKADLAREIGEEMAMTSQVFTGPQGYVIMYPIDSTTVNVGFWTWRRGKWPHREWMITSQKTDLEKDFGAFGETVHKIMKLAGNPSFYATHYHVQQPEHCFNGRVCLIGDAAHAMPPHAGAGASQAMEDSYVLAEVLHCISKTASASTPTQEQVAAAFRGYEAVRSPRYKRVTQVSVEGMNAWTHLFDGPVSQDRLEQWTMVNQERFQWIWYYDVADGGKEGCRLVQEALKRKVSQVALARREQPSIHQLTCTYFTLILQQSLAKTCTSSFPPALTIAMSAPSISTSSYAHIPHPSTAEEVDSLPSSSAGTSDDEDESDAEREWRESLQQLELLLTMVLVPYMGKYFGRKCAYWGWAKYMEWQYPVSIEVTSPTAFKAAGAVQAAASI